MFQRILLATDFSKNAHSAYAWAEKLAQSNQGTVVLVHALEDDLVATAPVFAGYMQAGVLDVGRYREEFRAAAKRALEEAADAMVLPDEFVIEAVASEPMVQEPVLAVWDANGAMYVAEMRSYMQNASR